MAVQNKYVDALTAADKLTSAAFSEGAKLVCIVSTFEVAAADDDASVFRVAKIVNSDLIPVKFELYNDAIAGATDYEVGLYEPTVDGVLGAAIDIDVFLGTTDINAGNARGSPVDALGAVNLSDAQKRIYELAGDTISDKKIGYDIAVTANTIGSAAGTITLIMWFVQG